MQKLITSAFMGSGRICGRAVAALTIVVGLAGPALAQDDGAEPVRRAIVGFEFSGYSQLFPDENDAALKRALQMIPSRVKEILESKEVAGEIGDQFPRALVYSLLDNIGGPMRMIATQRGFDAETGQPRLGAVLSMHFDDAGSAKSIHSEIEKLRAMAGEEGPPVSPSTRFPGMIDVQVPFGIVSYGPREANDGWRYEVIYGDIPDPDAVFDLLPDAAMKGSVGRGVIDFAAASPFTAMLAGMANMAGEQAGVLVDYFKGMGLLGPDAIAAEWEAGYPGDYAQETWRIRRAGQYAEGLGLSRELIGRDVLAALPVDASFMSIKKMDPQREFAKAKEMMQSMGGAGSWDEVAAQIHEAIGIDLEKDLVNALGHTGAMYFADSTGGGSLLSGVMLVELSNPRTMIETINTLAARLNYMVAEQIDTEIVSVKADTYVRNGIAFMEMRVRGAPIPSMPTMAVAGNWLVVSPTPQGCLAAASQAQGNEGTSALRNRMLNTIGIRADAVSQMTVINPRRTIRDGYSVLALLSGMLENAVRSPSGERDPGMVLPMYSELAADAHPIMMTGKWDGDDYVVNTVADRSALVNAAAILGVGDVGEVLLGAALGVGVAGGLAAQNEHGGGDFDWDDENEDEWHDTDEHE